MPPDAAIDVDDGAGLLLTRLRVPNARAFSLARTRLIATLDAARDQRLILVTAAAGYGKTSLLAQWHDHATAQGARIAWLSADDEDLSPGKLIAYLVRAVNIAGVDTGPSLTALSHTDGAGARQRLRQLINIIARDGRPVTLIIDDVDALSSRELLDVLTPLLRWAPDNLLIVLSGRTRPDIAIASLRVQGMVTEIGPSDLQFDVGEVMALFGPALDRKDADAIFERSVGWPAIIQLLLGLWRRSDERGALITGFEMLRSISGDYLSEQILAELPDDIRAMLIAVSLLDIITEPAAAALCQDEGHAWARLLTIDTFRPFLIEIAGASVGWRLHPILRDTLVDAFNRLPLVERQVFHRRMARWHDHRRHLIRSVRHALLAGDTPLAAHYIFAAGATRIWIRQGKARLEAIDALLDDAALDAIPRLKLLRALTLIKRGALPDAAAMFAAARAELGTTDQSDTDLHFDLLLVESTLLFNQCEPSGDEYLSIYAQRMEQIDANDDVVLGNVKTLMSLSCQQRGLPVRAADCAREAQVHYARANLPHGSFFVELHRGAAHFATGDTAAADIAFDRAQALAKRHFADDPDKQLLVSIMRAEVACDAARFDLAAQRLQGAVRRLGAMEAWHAVHAIVHGSGTSIDVMHGDFNAVHARLDAAEILAETRGLTGLRPFLTAQRMSCLALSGDTAEASRIAIATGLAVNRYQNVVGGEMLWREREAVLSAFCRIAMVNGEVERIADLIEQPMRDFTRSALSRPRIHLHIFGALAGDMLGDDRLSDHHLFEALNLAERSGHFRIFTEEGPHLRGLLARYAARVADAAPANHMLAALERNDPLLNRAPVLTPREGEVLAQLEQGLSAKRIARSLDLTENTVKFHLKNIYGKLRVNNRSGAITRARTLAQSIESTLQ